MVDVVIPVRTELQPGPNTELRYALRAIEKHLKNVGRVWIIGQCPEWLNINTADYLPHKESEWFRKMTKNIHDKLKLACQHEQVTEKFLYYNDDHFLLSDFDAEKFPLFHGGDFFGGNGQYLKTTIPDTLRMLKETVNPSVVFNFDVHAPIVIDKKAYLQTVGGLNWKKDFGYCIKTSYVYLTGGHNDDLVKGFDDLKIHTTPKNVAEAEALLKGRKIFSTADSVLKMRAQSVEPNNPKWGNPLVSYLETLFPDKSKYEI